MRSPYVTWQPETRVANEVFSRHADVGRPVPFNIRALMPEMPPVFSQPFDETFSEKEPKRSTDQSARKNCIASEEKCLFKNEHAYAESKSTTDECAESYTRDSVAKMVVVIAHANHATAATV